MKKQPIVVIIVTFLIAGLLDIKYKGLFFRSLPNSVQSYLEDRLK